MRAIPIPDDAVQRARASGAYADRVVIGEDDPTRNDVRPAEYLVRHSALYPGRLTFSALVQLDAGERSSVADGAGLWLTLDGAEVPWSIEVADRDEFDGPAAQLVWARAERDEARDAYAIRLAASDRCASNLRVLTAERDALQARLDEATSTIDTLEAALRDLQVDRDEERAANLEPIAGVPE